MCDLCCNVHTGTPRPAFSASTTGLHTVQILAFLIDKKCRKIEYLLVFLKTHDISAAFEHVRVRDVDVKQIVDLLVKDFVNSRTKLY